jgi:hypothetical protein
MRGIYGWERGRDVRERGEKEKKRGLKRYG